MATVSSYPLRVEAKWEADLSRWLWLVKWFLAIPHFVILALLWMGYAVLTVVAFFAILFTERYPRAIFEFNVGVLRWTWRVSYYTFGVNGTDRYPPFTLAGSSDYPTQLEVAYPERLSRWLPLVKWFLALPHLVIVGILAGGGSFVAWNIGQGNWAMWGNLIGVLVLVAVVILLFTGSYPRGLFDLILGLNRWVLRVAAYVGLMTDQYPPFRLDMGDTEPGGTITIPRPSGGGPQGGAPPPPGPAEAGSRSRWTGGRITAVVIGSLLFFMSLGLFGGGGFSAWLYAQRDDQGFYTVDQRFTSDSYAVTTSVAVDRVPGDWLILQGPGSTVGPGPGNAVRIRVTADSPREALFLGIGPTEEVDSYLEGVGRARVTGLEAPTYEPRPGPAPEGRPEDQGFWVASSQGIGTRMLLWRPQEGDWTVVMMKADGSRGVYVRADAGVRIPALPWIATGLLIGGAVFLLGAVLLIAIPVSRASRGTRNVF